MFRPAGSAHSAQTASGIHRGSAQPQETATTAAPRHLRPTVCECGSLDCDAAPGRKVLSGFGRAHLRDSLLRLPGQMRDDAQLPLDQHELAAMMHFMFLCTQEPFKPRFGGLPIRLGHGF